SKLSFERVRSEEGKLGKDGEEERERGGRRRSPPGATVHDLRQRSTPAKKKRK
ncbi:hypothetical protein U1Q18_006470, partial [Sarracenia purpurea var. burkii]